MSKYLHLPWAQEIVIIHKGITKSCHHLHFSNYFGMPFLFAYFQRYPQTAFCNYPNCLWFSRGASQVIVINLRAFKSFVFIYISAKLWNVLLVYFSLKRCPYAVYLCFQVPIRAFWVMVITVMEFQLFSWKKNQNARQLLHQAFTMCRLFPRMPLVPIRGITGNTPKHKGCTGLSGKKET